MIKPTDKIPVGAYIEDIEEMHKKTIDPLTGRMFLKHSLMDDIQAKDQRVKDTIKERFKEVESKAEHDADLEAEVKEKVIREMSLDNEKFIPDRLQRHWMIGQTHILSRDGAIVNIAIYNVYFRMKWKKMRCQKVESL